MSSTTSTLSDSRPAFAFAATGVPRILLRLEAAAAIAASLYGYQMLGGSWLWFVILFLIPDLSMLAFFAGPRVGSIVYNAVHTYLAPALLAAIAALTQMWWLAGIAMIWVAHIGVDRALGYGLKYGTAFGDTHLGRIGKAAR